MTFIKFFATVLIFLSAYITVDSLQHMRLKTAKVDAVKFDALDGANVEYHENLCALTLADIGKGSLYPQLVAQWKQDYFENC